MIQVKYDSPPCFKKSSGILIWAFSELNSTKNEFEKVILGTATCSYFEILALSVVPISIFYNLIGKAYISTEFYHWLLLRIAVNRTIE